MPKDDLSPDPRPNPGFEAGPVGGLVPRFARRCAGLAGVLRARLGDRARRFLAGPGERNSIRVMVFGAGRGTPAEYRLGSSRLRWVALLAGAAVLLGVVHYASLLVGAGEVSAGLVAERDALREQGQGYARDTERMAGRIEALEVQMRKLAVLAGADPLPARVAGIGGAVDAASGYDYVSDRIEDLSSRIARLDQQGLALERSMREKTRLLASTPSVWPLRGYIASGFGRRSDPFTGEIEWHQGLDIVASPGAPVRATADGVVVDAATSPTYGKNVVVSHGFGAVTRYAHLSRVDVRRGQRLRRGSVVGLVGNTGRSRAPHLHYEVWLDGRPQNPLNHIVDYTR